MNLNVEFKPFSHLMNVIFRLQFLLLFHILVFRGVLREIYTFLQYIQSVPLPFVCEGTRRI